MRMFTKLLPGFAVPALLLILAAWSVAAQDATPPVPDPALVALGGLSPSPHSHTAAAANISNSVTIPSWTRLVFQRFVDNQWDVYMSDSTAVRPIITAEGDDRFPSLNRGGTHLAYCSARNGTTVDLYIADADGRNEQLLVGDQFFTAFPDWSPNGRAIVYQAYVQGQYDLFTIDVQTRERKRLTLNRAFDGEPRWSPDGRQIIFTSDRDDGVYYVYVMNSDGTAQERLNSLPYSLHPSWSPDGRQIGFDADSDSDGWQELAIMNANGGAQRTIYDPGPEATVFAGSWSPDGRYLSFTEIQVEFRNGNWVWTSGRLRQWDSLTGRASNLLGGTLDWYPNWQTIDTLPPDSALKPLPPYTRAGDLPLTWSGFDRGGSGLRSFDLYWRGHSGQPWELLLDQTVLEAFDVTGVPGQHASFLTRARDNAWNLEPQRDAWAQETTFYNTAVTGSLTDNRGATLEGVPITLAPQPLFPLRTESDGTFAGYTVIPSAPTLTIGETNFLPVPPTLLPADVDFTRAFYLPPGDSVLLNGGFEQGDGAAVTAWTTGGNLPVEIVSAAASGSQAIRLGATGAGEGTAVLSQSVVVPTSGGTPTLAFMARATGDTEGDNSGLRVMVQGSETLYEDINVDPQWSLRWLDMRPWAGETVIINFVLRQDAADPPVVLWLDDASLGSAGSDLWTQLASIPAQALPGQTVRMQLRFGNRGTRPAGETDVSLTLAPGTTLLRANPPGMAAEGGWRWSRPELAPGTEGQITALIRINDLLPGSQIPLVAEIRGTAYEGLLSNNTSRLEIPFGAQLFLPLVNAPQVNLASR
jgi:Tol biopolymer transport system component